jgi:hypothetical protein
LVVNELPDEVLVYDLTRHKAHCLNQTAAQIWHLCDGRRTVPEIARRLAQELDKPVEEEVVWLALGQLSKSRLLEQELSRPDATSRLSRRAAVRRLGLGAALALPVVISIVAPTAVMAATGCIAIGQACTPSAVSQCCHPTSTTGCCDAGTCSSLKAAPGQPCSGGGNCCSGTCSGSPKVCTGIG